MLEGLKLRKPIHKQEAEVKKKFNFNTSRKAEGAIKVPAWLEDVPKSQLVHWWKIANSRKKLTAEETEKIKDVNYVLKNRYNVELPK